MSRLYEGERLGPALIDARRRTLDLYSLLREMDWTVPRLPIVNPPLWELAHLAWFQELWCLRGGPVDSGTGRRVSLLPGSDALFDSSTVAHASRWSLAYPPRPVVMDYLRNSLDATLQALAEDRGERRYFFELALLHEDMHGEAMLMTLQTLGLSAPEVTPRRSRLVESSDVEFAGGTFAMGSPPNAAGFVFDNELESHEVRVEAFSMARAPVTQGGFRQFVEDRGYERAAFWSDAGRQWLASTGLKAPIHWRHDDRAWSIRTFERHVPLDSDLPMIHVSLHEAQAWCRWAGRRLPSEAEWEFAARNGGAQDRYPWGEEAIEESGLGQGLDTLDSRAGLRAMLGGVWEWTSTPFLPYPGFRAGPYAEYSQPWFQSHQVLRGGSFATRSRLIHNRWRNFYMPGRNDVFAGFRTCAIDR